MQEEEKGPAWAPLDEETLVCTYPITDRDFPYDISEIRLKYSYKQDIVSILDIDNKNIRVNVAVGYIRCRDKMSHEEYGRCLMQQIESVLAGRPVVAIEAKKAAPVSIDISDAPIREGAYILFEYRQENVQGFKLNEVVLSVFCKRCSALNIKKVGGDDTDIKKNTKTRFACVKCTHQLTIDSTFHLVIPTGENRENLMRLEGLGVYNLSIRSVLFNAICMQCSALSILEPGKKTVCMCGAVLEIRPEGGAYKEVRKEVEDKKKTKGDMRALLQSGGTCEHYKKSSRIFIFPCCNTRYPCDICHNKNEAHPAVYASRMACGKCGAEGPVGPVCASSECREALTGKKTAHWEGGKGSRNKATMSRKDSRKYKK
ncbi:uncharacterized protein NEMAJ01_1071 [Nematocida major]|uniref:uncharacterized protein n=1 Tax=Nematocida major TaxID=1912982 RepID=UPI002008A0BA|nr:uncharacterized protein NEMAJ01_1071 [Nematocida major]KAH9386175.1 hypothetical protein NEMAJ01_1071 [Nematocida major]